MDQQTGNDWEMKIQQAARKMHYPPTPDAAPVVIQRIAAQKASRTMQLAGRTLPKRWFAPALALLLVVLLALSLVPGVRAQIQEFLQVGPLRIFFSTPSAPSIPTETMPSPPANLMNLAGQTTLAEAVRRWQHPLRLPTYPAGLGEPDLVFLQGPGDESLILVWVDPDVPGQVTLALQALAPGEALYSKSAPASVEQTTVNGEIAYWIVGDHLLEMQNGEFNLLRLVEGHVLVWKFGELTYRLETKDNLEEAVRIAESLQ